MKIHLAFILLFVGYCTSLPIEHIRLQKLLRISQDNGIKCSICKAAVEIIAAGVDQGVSKEAVNRFAEYICGKVKQFVIHRVCVPAVKLFGRELWGIFVTGVASPDQICGRLYGEECAHKGHFYASWNITIPDVTEYTPTSSDIGIKKGSEPSLKVLQITDIHLDNEYMEGSVAHCAADPLCCRKLNGLAVKGQAAAGKYGYLGYCDSNVLMVNSLFAHLVKVHDDVDYILWTGDIPPHDVWNQTQTTQVNAINQAMGLFQKYFPHKKVFPTLGNHEGNPVNSFPPPSIWGKYVPGDEWLYDVLVKDWGRWLPNDTQSTIKKGGYYTVLVKKGLRIVSINTNYGDTANWWLIIKGRDPAGMLQWLCSVLLQAEKDGEKVHIVGHIPPNEQMKWWSFNFYRIVERFQHTITAQFYAHTHHDEYRLFYDMKTFKTPINIGYLGPSVTTFHAINPGYRIYEIDAASHNSSMSVVDHHTFILDIAQTDKTGYANWTHEYNAKELYGMKDLSPASWDHLVSRMDADDAVFNTFYRCMFKQHLITKCTGQCKKNFLCTLKSAMNGKLHNFCNFGDKKEQEMYSKWFSQIYNKC